MNFLKITMVAAFAAVCSGLSTPASAAPLVTVTAPRVVVSTPTVVVRPARPGPQYVWVDGYWGRNARNQQVWVSGHWQHRPVVIQRQVVTRPVVVRPATRTVVTRRVVR